MNKKQRHYHFMMFDDNGMTALKVVMNEDKHLLDELVNGIPDDDHHIIECEDVVLHLYTPYELTTLEILNTSSIMVQALTISLYSGHDIYIEVLPATD